MDAAAYASSLLLALSLFVGTGHCIRCWECNSAYTPSCLDEFGASAIALVDCDQRQDRMSHLEVPHGEEDVPRATLCRKTVQNVEGDHRVIRGCGWVHNYGMLENRTCFNRAGTNQVQIYHCVCDHDACNAAAQTAAAAAGAFASLLLATVAS